MLIDQKKFQGFLDRRNCNKKMKTKEKKTLNTAENEASALIMALTRKVVKWSRAASSAYWASRVSRGWGR